MRIIDIISRSGRSLRSAKARTVLTALAISVGTFALTLTLAASNGAEQFVSKIISENFDPAELIVSADESITGSSDTSTPREYDPSFGAGVSDAGASIQLKQITDEDIALIKQQNFVESVREGISLNLQYISRDGEKKFVATASGLGPAQKPEVLAGTITNPPELGTVLLPEGFVSVLGFASAEEAVGQQITFAVNKPVDILSLDPSILSNPEELAKLDSSSKQEEKFTIAAVTKTPTTAQPGTELYLYINNSDARRLQDISTKGSANFGKFLTVFVKIKNGQDEAVLKQAQDDLQKIGFFSLSVKDTQDFLNQAIGILRAIVITFGGIAVIASIFGIINTMYISVLQRTREIGLMKSLGMRRRDIGRLFKFEAAWIGFLGGVLGSGLAIIVGSSLNPVIKKQLEIDDNLLIFNYIQIVALIVVLIVISIFAGFLPARKAAKLDPIEALRTE
ncbi:MAG: FtsX-like permease family protein [bacterium]|nr:FtsX-like permease family protein [bacterium]